MSTNISLNHPEVSFSRQSSTLSNSQRNSRENSMYLEHHDDVKKKKLTLHKPRHDSPNHHLQNKYLHMQEPTHNKFRADRALTIAERAGFLFVHALKGVALIVRIFLFAVFQSIGMVLGFILKIILTIASNIVTFKMRMLPSKKPPIRRNSTDMRFSQLNKWDETMHSKSFGKRLTLVIALNKVLVKGSLQKTNKAKETITVENYEGTIETYYLGRRPHLDEFLERMNKKFNLVIFTSSQPYFADVVIDRIDRYKALDRRFYREACERTPEGAIKKLELLEEGIHKVILLDTAEISAATHKNNLVLIKPWFEDKKDTELLKAAKYLESINDHVADVRDVLQKKAF